MHMLITRLLVWTYYKKFGKMLSALLSLEDNRKCFFNFFLNFFMTEFH